MKKPMAVDNSILIGKVAEAVKEIVPQATSIIYGSRARGDFRDDSDLDIIVLLPDSMSKEQQRNIRKELHYRFYDLSVEFNYEINISPIIITEGMFNERKTPFTVNVINEGIRL